MKCIFLIFFLPILIYGQNLVPNPSFECGEDICYPTQGANLFENYACFWDCPHTGTSDVFNTTLPDTCFSRMPYSEKYPYTHVGSQLPHTGNRFAGIFTFSDVYDIPIFSYREYIQTKLLQPFIPGDDYCAEMYVSLGEENKFAANNLGMVFNDEHYYMFGHETLPFTPQIIEDGIITDSINWVKIGGSFKAISAARYLIIGNFFTDANTRKININNGSSQNHYSYYFIDDVSIEKYPYPSFSMSGDLNICSGDTSIVSVSAGTDYIEWTNLEDESKIINIGPTFKVNPAVTTSYHVKAKGCNTIVEDTVTVIVRPTPNIDLGADTTICENTSLTLKASPGNKTYKWQDDSYDSILSITQKGKYSVTVMNGFDCFDEDEINISTNELPSVKLGEDSLVCDQFFPITSIHSGDNISFLWSDGSTDSIFLPSAAGKYWLTVSNSCAESIDSINIYSMKDIFIPNVLTLNGDTLNSKFQVRAIGNKTPFPKLNMFDRWGKEIYSSNNYKYNWPSQEDYASEGLYFYVLTYPGCSSFKGWLHVIK